MKSSLLILSPLIAKYESVFNVSIELPYIRFGALLIKSTLLYKHSLKELICISPIKLESG